MPITPLAKNKKHSKAWQIEWSWRNGWPIS